MLDDFEQLDDNEHMDIGADPERRVVLLVRKRSSEVSAIQLELALNSALQLLGEPHGWALLFDTRLALGRSGPEFEREVAQLREYMLRQFTRVAVLVRSAVGEMQVQRLLDPKARMVVVRDLDRALEFLAETAGPN